VEVKILDGKTPPKTLKASGKRLWKDALSGWDIQAEQFTLLLNLCECADRMAELTATLRREGQVVTDRFGQARPHPASLVLKAENGNFSRLYRLLALEPPHGAGNGPGRPVGWQADE
jgi:hypothetical protein